MATSFCVGDLKKLLKPLAVPAIPPIAVTVVTITVPVVTIAVTVVTIAVTVVTIAVTVVTIDGRGCAAANARWRACRRGRKCMAASVVYGRKCQRSRCSMHQVAAQRGLKVDPK
jgi:hypothetical protein